jgi:plastocyanin
MRGRAWTRIAAVVGFTAALLLAVAVVAAGSEADVEVRVTADGFVDARTGTSETVIRPGQTIVWVWEVNDHSVTHDGDPPAFDSHPGCTVLGLNCGSSGDTWSPEQHDPDWTWEEGTYRYRSHRDENMTGKVVVRTPKPTPTPAPDSPEPTPSPSPSPTDDAGEGDDDGGQDEAASRSTARSSGQATRPPAQRATREDRTDRDEEEVAAPDVAPPEQDFEPFPSPSPDDPSPSAEIGDDLAVDIPPPGGLTRGTWIAIAFAALSLTVGTFTKVVLFGGFWA